ncbi:CpaE family protein [Pseudoruegeria sp. SHC-113]|uniref:AAA family ATPase n=1 Tax=Pseudoruegeria sp. SHC-113 TaxID=2855439 RepID=UPI0021BB6294|nr:AAA family ATPase [Pseudoruegeria sp. SHC-113]MCT8161367.1 AAA family ATPase [Pseudoruegeria sp. SHC-113]
MSSGATMLKPEPAPLLACTISRDVQNFDLLIEDMETELGESWGDLGFEDAAVFLKQDDALTLEFVAIAVDEEDEAEIDLVGRLVTTAKERGIRVILIADNVSPNTLHRLMRMGAQDFIPYPLPENELHDAIERIRRVGAEPAAPSEDAPTTKRKARGDRSAVILPVHGMAGGTGASTLAVNLAWELATIDKKDPPRVCLLDFDLQFGSISTFLDLPRREIVYELLSATENMDADSFMQALLTYNDKLHVLTAPPEMLPLDILGPEDVDAIIEIARTNFDYVVIDMPSTLISWTEAVLAQAHIYFATLELDMRSAQNTLRMIKALKAEQLPVEKLRYVLNRGPKFTDLSGKSRVKRMAESLDIKLELLLPDGAKQVSQSEDHGMPLAEGAAKNPLRKEIAKLAQSIHERNLSSAETA